MPLPERLLPAFRRRPARAFGAWLLLALTLWTGHVQAQATNSLTPEGATSFISDADLGNVQNPYCNQGWNDTFKTSRQQALEVQLANDNRLFKYAVSGAYAAQCTNRLIDYAWQLQSAVKSIQSAAQAGDPAKAAITLIANQILESVFNQLFSSLMSQVCTITKDVTSAANSVLQNAICLPGVNLGIGSVFNFDVSLNLPNLTCDGVAINPVGYFDVNPQTGVGTMNGTAIANSIASGIYSGSAGYSTGGEDMPIGFRPDDSDDIYGEPDPIALPGDTGGDEPEAQLGTVSANSSFQCFDLNKAIANRQQYSTANYIKGVNGYCAKGVRTGLCAGGIRTFCSGGHGDAYQYGPALEGAGYQAVANQNTANYVPQPGDIIVIQPQAGHPVGHIQMYLGGGVWASDYKTTDKDGIKGAAQQYTIYRPTPNVNRNANGSCR